MSVMAHGVGRGPTGVLRNIKAMTNEKLLREYGKVLNESPRDEEACNHWRQEIDRRAREGRFA